MPRYQNWASKVEVITTSVRLRKINIEKERKQNSTGSGNINANHNTLTLVYTFGGNKVFIPPGVLRAAGNLKVDL